MAAGVRDPLEWAFSKDGTLVYARVRTHRYRDRSLVWVDRDGTESPSGLPPPVYDQGAHLSPDGHRVAVPVTDEESGEWDVWVYDFETGAPTRVTFNPGEDGNPIWTPDGERIVFFSDRAGPLNLFRIDAHGGGDAERPTESQYDQYPHSFTPDGKVLFYVEEGRPDSGSDLWVLSLDGDSPRATPLLRSRYDEQDPEISPDGRWLAYLTDETGTPQVVVRPYPEMDRKWPVSVEGAGRPVWHPRGDSIFFVDLEGRLMEARVRTQPTFSVEPLGRSSMRLRETGATSCTA